jgi:hypothetical protein
VVIGLALLVTGNCIVASSKMGKAKALQQFIAAELLIVFQIESRFGRNRFSEWSWFR